MSRLIQSLLDPGLYAERYGLRGFIALVAFCAITEAAWNILF